MEHWLPSPLQGVQYNQAQILEVEIGRSMDGEFSSEREYDNFSLTYDEDIPPINQDHPMIGFIRDQVPPPASIIEYGIGTGRISVPLHRIGYRITGIDVSLEMLKRLRSKPESADMNLIHGSITEPNIDEKFDAVICMFNTLLHVHTLEGQVSALRRAADHLSPDGVLLLENTPAQEIFERHDRLSTQMIDNDSAWIVARRMNPVTQELRVGYIFIRDGRVNVTPLTFKYIWPSEIRLMASMAELEIVSEYGDWVKSPFDYASKNHIVVLRRK
ncbi:class I SAM-dependent methyltransferase [Streptomyces wuyuanensis]|uniref:class I SAM-dependent methyltransferase n=1 Tax=Streptomyces wuyuanensis TaxID=1196353 RepID=UPI003432DA0C